MSDNRTVTQEKRSYIPFGIAIGLVVGIVIGFIVGRVDITVPLGIILGGIIGLRIGKKQSPKDNVLIDAFKERRKQLHTDKNKDDDDTNKDK